MNIMPCIYKSQQSINYLVYFMLFLKGDSWIFKFINIYDNLIGT